MPIKNLVIRGVEEERGEKTQIGGDGDKVNKRSEVFSLNTILYFPYI